MEFKSFEKLFKKDFSKLQIVAICAATLLFILKCFGLILHPTLWEEKSATSPLSVYGFTKARAEYRVLEEFASGTYIFRTAWLYTGG